MTPKHFAALAAAAALCLAAALFVFSASAPWSPAAPQDVALVESLRGTPVDIARIEINQGGNTLTLKRNGSDWVLKEHESFPAAAAKVRALFVSLAEADLVEAKTRMQDRYALLSLEDPAQPGATSRLVRLVDAGGNAVAEVVVGKQRTNAFGSGKSGTYVRRPGEAQTWLVNTEITGGTSLRDWIEPRLFEARRHDIKRLAVKSPGQEDLDIELAPDGSEHLLMNIPEGMKIKYANSIDDIAEAARAFDFDEVRRRDIPLAGDKVSTVTLELANGLTCVFKIHKGDDGTWLTLEASGEGEAQKEAEELMARAKGWEFRIPATKADAILKCREDLLEKIAS